MPNPKRYSQMEVDELMADAKREALANAAASARMHWLIQLMPSVLTISGFIASAIIMFSTLGVRVTRLEAQAEQADAKYSQKETMKQYQEQIQVEFDNQNARLARIEAKLDELQQRKGNGN